MQKTQGHWEKTHSSCGVRGGGFQEGRIRVKDWWGCKWDSLTIKASKTIDSNGQHWKMVISGFR